MFRKRTLLKTSPAAVRAFHWNDLGHSSGHLVRWNRIRRYGQQYPHTFNHLCGEYACEFPINYGANPKCGTRTLLETSSATFRRLNWIDLNNGAGRFARLKSTQCVWSIYRTIHSITYLTKLSVNCSAYAIFTMGTLLKRLPATFGPFN